MKKIAEIFVNDYKSIFVGVQLLEARKHVATMEESSQISILAFPTQYFGNSCTNVELRLHPPSSNYILE